MPIVTAVVVTVTAAIATTTLATVGAAAIAIGTLVGTVGLGLSVIGMATGNKTLSKIGGYMGMAGGVLGVGGALAGGMSGFQSAMSTAWDDGVGSLFQSTKPVGQEALGRGIVAGANPEAGSAFAKAGQQVASQSDLGNAIVANTPMPAGTSTSPTILAPDLTDAQKAALITPEHEQLARNASSIQALANSGPVTAPTAPTAPGAADVLSQVTEGAKLGSSVLNSGPQTPPASSGGFSEMFNKLPDWAKGQLAITGVQGLTGAMSGWFEGASEEQKIELQRQAFEWQKNQDRITNASRGSAPLVQFGAINRA